jgi:hypothetical protein
MSFADILLIQELPNLGVILIFGHLESVYAWTSYTGLEPRSSLKEQKFEVSDNQQTEAGRALAWPRQRCAVHSLYSPSGCLAFL